MRISFLPKKVLITCIVAAVAGGAAAVAIPVIAARSNSAATAPAPGSQDAAFGAKAVRHPHLLSAVLRATVKETGLSRDALRQRLRAGQTITQIAGDKAQAVESDVLTRLKTRIDKAVGDGKVTKDQEASLLAKAKTRVEKLMNTSLADLRHGKHERKLAPTASPNAS